MWCSASPLSTLHMACCTLLMPSLPIDWAFLKCRECVENGSDTIRSRWPWSTILWSWLHCAALGFLTIVSFLLGSFFTTSVANSFKAPFPTFNLLDLMLSPTQRSNSSRWASLVWTGHPHSFDIWRGILGQRGHQYSSKAKIWDCPYWIYLKILYTVDNQFKFSGCNFWLKVTNLGYPKQCQWPVWSVQCTEQASISASSPEPSVSPRKCKGSPWKVTTMEV